MSARNVHSVDDCQSGHWRQPRNRGRDLTLKLPGRTCGLGALQVVLCMVFFAVGARATTVIRTSAFDYNATTGVLSREIVEPDSSTFCLVKEHDHDGYGHEVDTYLHNCNGTPGSSPGVNSQAPAPASGDLSIFPARYPSYVAQYTSDQRFPTQIFNATISNPSVSARQSETRSYDGRFGVMNSLTGPNGLTTQWAYDDLGRKILELRADGNGTRWDYQYCTNIDPAGIGCARVYDAPSGTTGAPGASGTSVTPAYAVTVTPVSSVNISNKTSGPANGAYVRTYYDALNRAIRTETQGFDGSSSSVLIYQDTQYNNLGEVVAKSRPYYANAPTVYWSHFSYDILERIVTQTNPDPNKATGSVTRTSYQGLTTTLTDDLAHPATETRNVAGQLWEVTDANGKTLVKTYDPLGNVLTITDQAGNVTTLLYDPRGRKTDLYDPDLGHWQYRYDALGQQVLQQDANGNLTSMAYDVLGRMTSKVGADQTSNWYYDNYNNGSVACTMGVGKLCEASTTNGYDRLQTYDSLGRPSQTLTTVGSQQFLSTTYYDANGRLLSLAYPAPPSSAGATVQPVYSYTALGYLQQVSDYNTKAVYWQANVMDAEQHLVQFTYGNGITTVNNFDPQTGRLLGTAAGAGSTLVQNMAYTYDTLGNLHTRYDSIAAVGSQFGYDNLNRVTAEQRVNTAANASLLTQWGYDDGGNITGRSDLGTYVYNPSGANSSHPHAVLGVVTGSGQTVDGVVNPVYGYDNNGNLLWEQSNGNLLKSVSWYSFNKLKVVQNASGAGEQFLYDSEENRVSVAARTSTGVVYSTVYLNGGAGDLFFEQETNSSGEVKYKYYLNAGGGTIGVRTFSTVSGWTTDYWHKDHLGSTAVVTDQTGAVVDRMAYEPYGKRLNLNGAPDAAGTINAQFTMSTRRGYTGHEMMDEVGLVNMNGRVYDPAIGRFLSADPLVQAPDNMQSYNRYAYGLNNPLIGTDPSGYCFLGCFWHGSHLKRWAPYVIAFYAPDISNFLGVTSVANGAVTVAPGFFGIQSAAIAQGMVGGALSGAVAGGDLKSTVLGTFTGGALGWAGDLGSSGNVFGQYAVHAAVGCIRASSAGGNCGQGAVAELASQTITDMAKGVDNRFTQFSSVVIAGGTASRIMGGSFANGAETAAYGYLFNFLVHMRPVINPNGIGEEKAYAIDFEQDVPTKELGWFGRLIKWLGNDDLDWVLKIGINGQKWTENAICFIQTCYGLRYLNDDSRAQAFAIEPQVQQAATNLVISNNWDLNYLSRDQVQTIVESWSSIPNFTKIYGSTYKIMKHFPAGKPPGQ